MMVASCRHHALPRPRSKVILINVVFIKDQRRPEEHFTVPHLDALQPSEITLARLQLCLRESVCHVDCQIAKIDRIPQQKPIDAAVFDVLPHQVRQAESRHVDFFA